MVSSFDIVVAVCEWLPCELSKPNSRYLLAIKVIFADKDNVVRGLILSARTTTYLSKIVDRVSATQVSFNTDVAFVLIDFLT